MGSEIRGAFSPATLALAAEPDGCKHEDVIARIGQITRALHNNLRELGMDKIIEEATHQMPNARDRLDYVARMTEQAAQRVLNATDAAMPLQDRIEEGVDSLMVEWKDATNQIPAADGLAPITERTLAFLGQVKSDSSATRQHLLDIMMAQDFQDLTGQVIKKVNVMLIS